MTAENGDVVIWKVTATVQYGMSFTYESDPTTVVLTAGVVDSTDTQNNDLYGNGLPAGILYAEGTYVYAIVEEYDAATEEGPPDDYAELQFLGDSTGTLDGAEVEFTYILEGTTFLASDVFDADSFELVITKYGTVGKDIIGTFGGTVLDEALNQHNLSDGFLKVLRIEDDTSLG